MLRVVINSPLPTNLFNPTKAPRGNPITVAVKRAIPETLRERKII